MLNWQLKLAHISMFCIEHYKDRCVLIKSRHLMESKQQITVINHTHFSRRQQSTLWWIHRHRTCDFSKQQIKKKNAANFPNNWLPLSRLHHVNNMVFQYFNHSHKLVRQICMKQRHFCLTQSQIFYQKTIVYVSKLVFWCSWSSVSKACCLQNQDHVWFPGNTHRLIQYIHWMHGEYLQIFFLI